MLVKKPSVGPILGHITEKTANIFIRAGFQYKDDTTTRIAVIRYRELNKKSLWKIHTTPIDREADHTAVVPLTGLTQGTKHIFQIGWCDASEFFLADRYHSSDFIWSKKKYKFTTRDDTHDKSLSYLIGSCRYLKFVNGRPLGLSYNSVIFKAMTDQKIKTDALVMVGDQIYADDMNAFAPDTELPEFFAKYRGSFAEKHIRKLMAKTPTYMILDDHEIEDNWPANNFNDSDLFKNAMRAYEIYQSSHGPAHKLQPDGTVSKKPDHYWYQFSHGAVEWFVLDTRTQRNLSPEDRRIIDASQEKALLDWLATSTAKAKFVVTTVMFYPDLKIDGGDSWKSFGEQRTRILECIRVKKVKNVFFISGDVHASMTSKLTHSEDSDFIVHTIVCSPLKCIPVFGPPKADSFMLDQVLCTVDEATYSHALTSTKVISTDNFSRVTIDANTVSVTFHDKKGTLLEAVSIPLI